MGDYAAARAIFEHVIEDHPELVAARLGLAEAQIGAGDAPQAIDALAALREEPTPDAWVLSAVAYVALGRVDEVDPWLTGATDRRGVAFVAPHRRVYLETLTGAGEESPGIVFVGGAGPDGVRWVARALARQLGTQACLWDGTAPRRSAGHGGGAARRPQAGPEDSGLPVTVERYLDHLGSLPRAPGRWAVDCTPGNLLYAGLLFRAFPRARFVHVVEDGRTVAAQIAAAVTHDPVSGATLDFRADPVAAARHWEAAVLRTRYALAPALGRAHDLRVEDLVAPNGAERLQEVVCRLGARSRAGPPASIEAQDREDGLGCSVSDTVEDAVGYALRAPEYRIVDRDRT